MDGEVGARIRELVAAEDAALQTARQRAGASISVPSPEAGSLLRWTAGTTGAQSIVEVGAAAGVSGLWLLAALPEKGVLTSIERDPHVHGLATEAFEAVHAGSRVRAILGDPDEVLPRLSDASYDLVLLQGSAFAGIAPLEHARRLLRPGGVLVARGMLAVGDHADARARFLPALVDDPAFTVTLLPLDAGTALATRLEDDEADADDQDD